MKLLWISFFHCRILAGLTVAALCARGAFGDTYPRQNGVDVLHYTFGVTLHDENDEIEGETTIEVRFLQAEVNALVLDLASQVSGKGMSVTGVKVAGAPVEFEHKDNRLSITVDPSPPPGERRSFRVSYHGIPRAGLRVGKNRYGERTFFSLNWPDKARQWLPSVDHPYDKATSEFMVNAPAHFQVVANGLLEDETDLGNGRRLTHWKQSVPIAMWLNAVAAAHFASHHAGMVKGVPLETWVYPQDRDRLTANIEAIARRTLEFYSEHIGPYPYQKLANVQAAGLSGGTEHASAIFYGEYNLTGEGVSNLIAHEIAHQWFGDSVTERDWDDVWLSEGFATYFTLLFLEHDKGRDAFLGALERSRSSVFNIEKNNTKLAVIHNNLADTKKVLNNLVYQKGGWTLHMLRGILGDEAFWAGIKNYYDRYRDANASTADFKHAMEESSGKDLAWFFDQWLKRPGSPELKGSWLYAADRKQIEIELSQAQPGEPYRLPLELGIGSSGRRPRYEKIEMSTREASFTVKADEDPRTVNLDPNRWVLMKQDFASSPASLPVQDASPALAPVTAPPKELGLDPFYTKYVSARGLPVVGSAKVSDFALREAAYLVDQMLSHRPEIREAMIKKKIRVAVMAYSERTTDIPEHRDMKPKDYWNMRARGLGASLQTPVVSCAEENLLNYRGDPYSTENILIHEFGHGIHGVGLASVDPTFGTRLRKAYKDAKDKGLWKGTYAGSNSGEYWAEAVQSWFDTNRQNDSQHNHVDTREELKAYDPDLANLCNEVFGDGPWRYIRPDHRKEKAHLAGFDLSKAPAFQWEPELLEARRKHYEEVERKSNKDRAPVAKKAPSK